jgi:hypothetical protein
MAVEASMSLAVAGPGEIGSTADAAFGMIG